jgi:hypothetical protein
MDAVLRGDLGQHASSPTPDATSPMAHMGQHSMGQHSMGAPVGSLCDMAGSMAQHSMRPSSIGAGSMGSYSYSPSGQYGPSSNSSPVLWASHGT